MRLAGRSSALGLALSLSLLPRATDAQAPATRPCSADAARHFDFWQGRWLVQAANGLLAGHNTIRPILGDCALHERYTTPSGYEGESFNVYDASRGVWHQTWIDNGGLLLRLEGGYEGDRMVMQGPTVGANGAETLNRITWSRVDGDADRVRQHWETSTDGGATWATRLRRPLHPSVQQRRLGRADPTRDRARRDGRGGLRRRRRDRG